MSEGVISETEDSIYFLESSIAALNQAIRSVSSVTKDKDRFRESLKNEQYFTVVPQHDYSVKRGKLSELLEPQIIASYEDLNAFVSKLRKKKDVLTNRCQLTQSNFEETLKQSGEAASQLKAYEDSLDSLQVLQQKKEQLRAKLETLRRSK